MKKILILFLIFSSFSYSQKTSFEGKVFDKQTKQPLTYCNIGIINKNLGTLSNVKGEFVIDLTKISTSDTIIFSYLGYKSLNIKLNDLINRKDSIFLKSNSMVLNEVTLESYNFSKKMTLGFEFRHPRVSFFFYDFKSGSEVCRYFKNDKTILVEKLIFQVNENELKNLKLRVNFYDVVNGKPNEKLNIEDIYIETKHHQGRLKFNLKDNNIILDSDFFISLEAIDVKGNGEFLFGGEWYGVSSEGGKTYSRKSSFAKWTDEWTIDNSNLKQKVPHSIGIRLITRINTK
ncbi:carboxypeptidase-like regulatory domain-containing protein [Winogradskyella undariae]|uniref:carboxypeptidase-like regulatory domain-containing protein n=1 Tax=Winogradskyella undariae TaxID=1285465 RepID=UPI0015C88A2A|nr:carboxypeptidase-like regulatory domain-containing protein [Winogradskyella undariae]QNK77757.1 carboxypeptidase-like regulatory domain-containing protein [Winogradskyella sp. PAMC22761]